MALHETQLNMLRHALQSFNHAVALGLANSNILSLTTAAGLKAAILALVTHETDTNGLRQANLGLQYAIDAGVLTDANVASADTVAGIRSIFTTADSSLTSTDERVFAWG